MSGQSGGSGGSSDPVPPSVSYAAPLNISSAGTHAGSLAIADFNGDGKLDIAASNFYSNTIAVFLNQGGGIFAAPILSTILIPNGLGSVVLGDFNEDGKLDLIVSTISGPEVALVLLGNGDGTFTQSAAIPNSTGFLHARVADLNGDKHLDYIGCGSGNMQVAQGNGDGTFQAVVYLPNGPLPNTYFGCDVGDLNGDTKLDILGADFGTNNLVLFTGNGDGTFQAPMTRSSGSSDPVSVAAADFNGDGKLDTLVGYDAGSASLIPGNGDGSFGMPYGVFSGNAVNGSIVLAADLNNDEKVDALTIEYSGGVFTIELSPGTPLQSQNYAFNLAPGLSDIAVGDLNGDGLLDIVIVNSQTDQVTIFLSKK